MFARTITVTAIAATSSRVYVGGADYQRLVWAIDPFSGVDQDWALRFAFVNLHGAWYDSTTVTALRLDAGRLYIGGEVRTADGQQGLVVADAATGARVPWAPGFSATAVGDVVRIGPAIVVAGLLKAFDPTTAAPLPFTSAVFGAVTVAAAPEGVVVGGALADGVGVPRNGLASINLDTWSLEPWTAALSQPPLGGGVTHLGTDGTWLIAVARDGRVAKIDPATGAVVAELPFPAGSGLPLRIRHGVVYLVYLDSLGFGPAVWRAGALTIATWSFQYLPITLANGQPFSLDVDGDTMYLAGGIDDVNGVSRPGLAAVSISTGAVHAFRPNPDDTYYTRVLAQGGRVWAAGAFRAIGGAARRGLAELDPATGAALPWHPDVPDFRDVTLDIGPDGDLYVGPANNAPSFGATLRAGGQAVPAILAFSTATGRRRPWRHHEPGFVALVPDCVVVATGCLPRASAPPATVVPVVNASTLSLQWTLPPSGARTGVRLEFGALEGRRDLYQVDLPVSQTTFTSPAPPGRYVARLRSLDGAVAGPPSDDVSFAVGAGAVAAPLDATVGVERSRVTFAWTAPSTGAPEGYVLDVGSAPGLANLASLPIAGASTSLQVTAPPGRYWARLRASQGGALSLPTPELYVAAAVADVALCGGSPYSPDTLAATVAAGVVQLTWQVPSAGVTPVGYRLVAGTAPGRNDIATIELGAVLAFSTPAPQGIYYVSIASVDACGTVSGLSAAIAVTVP
ncbi:MAG: PQQ-binding-like beta-propeller repeat protein [Vicinamibacterales bacterium]